MREDRAIVAFARAAAVRRNMDAQRFTRKLGFTIQPNTVFQHLILLSVPQTLHSSRRPLQHGDRLRGQVGREHMRLSQVRPQLRQGAHPQRPQRHTRRRLCQRIHPRLPL